MTMGMAPIPDHVRRWVALRTSARWEKQLAALLGRCNVPVYLPLMTKLSVYRSKRRAAEVPIFPGYVFCSEDDYRGNRAISPTIRNRVAQILPPSNYDELRRELQGISEFLASRELVQERVYGRPGDTVRIIRGPFAGEVGTICRLKPGRRQIVLTISFLGARLEVDIEEHLLQKA